MDMNELNDRLPTGEQNASAAVMRKASSEKGLSETPPGPEAAAAASRLADAADAPAHPSGNAPAGSDPEALRQPVSGKASAVSGITVWIRKLLWLFALWGACACTHAEAPETAPEPGGASTLYISIAAGGSTRASGSGHGHQAEDNTVRTLEIFVFRNEGEDAGQLETYKRFEGAALSGLTNLEIKTTTGKKIIHAVANSHRSHWPGITTLPLFRAEESVLSAENLKDFVMTGSAEAALQATTSLTLSLSRLAARVCLASLRTDFAGTPYAGEQLSGVKVYLVNVRSAKRYADGTDSASPRILNAKRYVPADSEGTAMSGMLYEELNAAVGSSGSGAARYFYCYENRLAAETGTDRFTRLVIQGDLNGRTYYYPVDIGRGTGGPGPADGKQGISRNTDYTVRVTIKRPGSTDPDTPVERGTMTAALNIQGWVVMPAVEVEF